jgi:hypothetical protein
MNHGKYVFSQLFEFLPKYEFEKCIARYKGNYKNKGFTCRNQFLAMSFGQLTNRESLRDTVSCLMALSKNCITWASPLKSIFRLWLWLMKTGIGGFTLT